MVGTAFMTHAASFSPLWGGVRGGGAPDIGRSKIPLSLILPHEGGGSVWEAG